MTSSDKRITFRLDKKTSEALAQLVAATTMLGSFGTKQSVVIRAAILEKAERIVIKGNK